MSRIGTAFVMAVLGGISVANAFRMKHTAKRMTRRHEDHSVSNTTLNATLDFPNLYTKMMEPIKLLGKGSFGEAWLVRDLQPQSPRAGQLIVMKLLYIKEAGTSKHLTWEMASKSALLKKEVIKVAKECEISKMMQGIAEKSDHPGAMRIMNCFGHNAPVSSSGKLQNVRGQAAKRPLYLLLENCGGTDLTKFMKQMAVARTVDLALVQNLYKQLMEGLAFLRQLPNPWVHHDLKPDNIVVKTQTEGLGGATTYSLHLIDFGAAAETTYANSQTMTPSTTIYAPPEWGVGGNFAMCPGGHSSKPDGNCGTAFDIYSAGAIFIEMITGQYMADLKGCYNNAAKDLNHKEIAKLTADNGKFKAELLSNAVGSAYQTVATEFLAGTPERFLPMVAQQLKQAAGDRPIADHVMETDFLVSVVTPPDLDYVAAKEKKKRDELMAQQLELQIGGVQDHAGGAQDHADQINDMEVDSGLRRFKLHDKVEVYSVTAFEATGKGWVVGTVTELILGLKVMVTYDVGGVGALEKELPDGSELLRPFIEPVELPEATAYLPKAVPLIGGKKVLVPVDAAGKYWLATNKYLNAGADGISYRTTKDMGKSVPDLMIEWGERIRGVDEGDGWVRVQLPEQGAEAAIIADEDYRPSSGERGGLLDVDVDAQVGDNSHCPSWCDECEIAFHDAGVYKGKRRTHMSKWASFCYVDMHKTVANKQEGQSEGGAMIASQSMVVNVGKKQFKKWLCQDLDLLRLIPEYSPRQNWK